MKKKNIDPKWHPNPDEAYKAAEMVTHGNCAAQIAQELFKSKTGRYLNRIKTLLQFAEKEGIFTLTGQTNLQLAESLKEWCNNPDMHFHVVNNHQIAYGGNPAVDEALRADAVARKAAEVVADKISVLMDKHKKKKKTIVIANAGGFAVSRIVRFLASQKLVPEECDPRQLLFISLNSASMPTDYGRSANTLAVRMAEIYGGNHIALCPIWPKKVRDAYEEAVHNIDLLVCGAGSERGILFTWLKDHAGITLPAGAIGDMCLMPISKDGCEVPLDEKGRDNVAKFLNLHPTYTDLHALAGRDGVVFVPMGYRNDELQPDPAAGSRQRHSKHGVTRAILKHALARTCVLGTTLARDLLESP